MVLKRDVSADQSYVESYVVNSVVGKNIRKGAAGCNYFGSSTQVMYEV